MIPYYFLIILHLRIHSLIAENFKWNIFEIYLFSSRIWVFKVK